MNDEPGAERVLPVLHAASISTVNLSEVISAAVNRGGRARAVARQIDALPVRVEPFDRALAIDAGDLRLQTASRGLSLGDRACLALARREGCRVLTADRAWAGLEIGVDIELIR